MTASDATLGKLGSLWLDSERRGELVYARAGEGPGRVTVV